MKKKILSLLLIITIFIPIVNVHASQDRSYNFNKNYTLTGNYANDIVAVAKAQLWRTLGYSEAWCADFVNDCARLTGMSDSIIPYNYSGRGSCTSLYNYMINNCGAKRVYDRQAGDIVFYYCPYCDGGRYVHVGIIQDGIYSIEGNVNSQVYRLGGSIGKYIDSRGHSVSSGVIQQVYVHPNYGGSTVSDISPKTLSLGTPFSYNVSDDTATVEISVSNPYNITLGNCGVMIGKSVNAMSIAKSERALSGTKKIWYDIKNECGISLEGGTTYYYKFYLEANGTTYYSDVQSFKTTGGVVIPPAPGNVNVSEKQIAAGRNITVVWDYVDTAASYKVNLNCKTDSSQNKETTTSINSASFNLSQPGTYTVSVSAVNSAGTGAAATSEEVQAMPKQKVVFQVIKDGIFLMSINDDDEDWPKIVSEQMVDWGTSAVTPIEPIRDGYTFNGWDKDYSCIKEETVLTAQYRKRNYLVTFTDHDGTILSSQRVDYGDSAKLPDDPTPPDGYVFVGWDKEDYKKVTDRTNVNAVYAWEDEARPAVMSITSAARNDAGNGYEVLLDVTNTPNEPTKGRIIVSLKTQDGKMVASAIEEVTLSASEVIKDKKLFVSYDGVATIAEAEFVGLVESNKTGIPLANSVTKDIDLTTKWSDWTTTEVSGNYETESRIEYRYSDRSTTTSTSPNLAGWSLLKSTSSWGPWSDYSQTKVTASSIRQVDSYSVNPTYKTQWRYSGYHSKSGKNAHCAACGGSYYTGTVYEDTGWLDYECSPTGKTFWCPNAGTVTEYRAWSNMNGYYMYYYTVETKQDEVSPGYTMYRYRDLVNTYYFDKWSDYTDWSPAEVTANENRAVETRTTYRYKAKDITPDMEDKTGESRTIQGNLGEGAAGKQATLMVYKQTNTDPTESQLEYIGETIISDNGDYSFDCIMREEPSEKTGDFIVVLGIEGGIRPIYIETIKAPLPIYTVRFTDVNGNIVSEQQVIRGESAAAPIPEEIEGATFARWNEDYTNVTDNLIIEPEYTKDKHTVIFLAHDNTYITSKVFDHGDLLSPLDWEDYIAGEYEFPYTQWDVIENGITTVTEDMVVKAIYEVPVHIVTFRNIDGDIIISEQIKEGEGALVPEAPAVSGMVFEKWSGNMSYTSVYEDMDIYPIYKYKNTVETPRIELKKLENSKQLVTLSSETSGAQLYYTTNSTNPLNSEINDDGEIVIAGTLYSKPFEVEEGTVISVVAVADNMNDSELVVQEAKEAIYYGDLNIDGSFNNLDLTILLRHSAEIDVIKDDDILKRADVNKDGAVNMLDAVKFIQSLAWEINLAD